MVLHDDLFETVSVDALFLVVAEDDPLNFSGLICGDGLGIWLVVLESELLHAVAVDLELFVTELLVSLVSRYD